jgi:hypothetical protein
MVLIVFFLDKLIPKKKGKQENAVSDLSRIIKIR